MKILLYAAGEWRLPVPHFQPLRSGIDPPAYRLKGLCSFQNRLQLGFFVFSSYSNYFHIFCYNYKTYSLIPHLIIYGKENHRPL